MTVGDELAAIEKLTQLLGTAPTGEVWVGDDAAVVGPIEATMLLATDLVAEGVHFDRRYSSLSDVGWKVLTANVSDMAAMGGRPVRAVVAVAGAWGGDLVALYEGLVAASDHYGCPLVGGDLSDAPQGGGMVVSVALVGTSEGRPPILRSGGRPGERLWVTGPLGAAAAGLALLRRRWGDAPGRTGCQGDGSAALDAAGAAHLMEAHRRPVARLAEGCAAAKAGATAMIDVSDGLGIDLDRLCRASGVGAVLERLPVTSGATEGEALGGGEDYELLVATPEGVDLAACFARLGLKAPIEIGRFVADPRERMLEGRPLAPEGYRHGT